ncbi:DUF2290 domain-containing protein [Paraglaciecola arctica]|uniref:DUF2290 domain-containing protein n=1 Tax=Paraglaciecola arctica TaxID=1128911 RepID=UPI001D04622A|nr:DUF2290 domain-containing protein [Paraglaciecola arctica]
METLTADLIGLSLCDKQNFPSIKRFPNQITEVGLANVSDLSLVLKNISYDKIYAELEKSHAYNLKMIDGALIQLMYRYKDDSIETHRLAFFPSPTLEEFQNNPEIYLEDEIYADVSNKNVVPFPIRFDFDCRVDIAVPIEHPRSHLTLGQYKNCRIPVNSALTPHDFLCFLLRNFYNTAFQKYFNEITQFDDCFEDSLFGEEQIVSRIIIGKVV